MRGGVIVVEVVDAVAPLRGPTVGGEEVLHCVCEIVACWEGAAVEEDWQRAVRHPAVGLEVELLRRGCRSVSDLRGHGFASSYARGEDAGSEMSAVDRLHIHSMHAQRSWNSGLPMTRAVRRLRVSVEFVVGRSAICLWMSWLVWAETSPPMRVDSRTWRAMSWPAALGGGWLGGWC